MGFKVPEMRVGKILLFEKLCWTVPYPLDAWFKPDRPFNRSVVCFIVYIVDSMKYLMQTLDTAKN